MHPMQVTTRLRNRLFNGVMGIYRSPQPK